MFGKNEAVPVRREHDYSLSAEDNEFLNGIISPNIPDTTNNADTDAELVETAQQILFDGTSLGGFIFDGCVLPPKHKAVNQEIKSSIIPKQKLAECFQNEERKIFHSEVIEVQQFEDDTLFEQHISTTPFNKFATDSPKYVLEEQSPEYDIVRMGQTRVSEKVFCFLMWEIYELLSHMNSDLDLNTYLGYVMIKYYAMQKIEYVLRNFALRLNNMHNLQRMGLRDLENIRKEQQGKKRYSFIGFWMVYQYQKISQVLQSEENRILLIADHYKTEVEKYYNLYFKVKAKYGYFFPNYPDTITHIVHVNMFSSIMDYSSK